MIGLQRTNIKMNGKIKKIITKEAAAAPDDFNRSINEQKYQQSRGILDKSKRNQIIQDNTPISRPSETNSRQTTRNSLSWERR